jgi:hypothetical protein
MSSRTALITERNILSELLSSSKNKLNFHQRSTDCYIPVIVTDNIRVVFWAAVPYSSKKAEFLRNMLLVS